MTEPTITPDFSCEYHVIGFSVNSQLLSDFSTPDRRLHGPEDSEMGFGLPKKARDPMGPRLTDDQSSFVVNSLWKALGERSGRKAAMRFHAARLKSI